VRSTREGNHADLAAQHRVLMPEHQESGILGHLTPGQTIVTMTDYRPCSMA
jgi:hypothetical protein